MDGETFPEHALQYMSHRYRGKQKESLKAKCPGGTNHVPTEKKRRQIYINLIIFLYIFQFRLVASQLPESLTINALM